MTPTPLRLFEAYGVELEYMIVDRETLSVLPVTDEVLKAVTGTYTADVELGPIAWSNELVLHVIELKTNGPAHTLTGLAGVFQDHVRRINRILEPMGGRLMPTAMHPWFDPHTETKLWPHDASVIYEAYDRIFSCQGHGWSNLQSVHLNLPFRDDQEFGRLHAAIRIVLPILPALAASSPITDLQAAPSLDNRLEVYRLNAKRIPSITGGVIPEPVFSREDYERRILQPMYREIAPHDPGAILQEEFLNSRGAIARFERNSIEIRVLDIQEHPAADLAIVAAIAGVLQCLVGERWSSLGMQQSWESEPLIRIYTGCVRDAESAVIEDGEYLRTLGLHGIEKCSARDLWRHLIDEVLPRGGTQAGEHRGALDVILEEGTLSRRILRAIGGPLPKSRVAAVYRTLCDCLENGTPFTGRN